MLQQYRTSSGNDESGRYASGAITLLYRKYARTSSGCCFHHISNCSIASTHTHTHTHTYICREKCGNRNSDHRSRSSCRDAPVRCLTFRALSCYRADNCRWEAAAVDVQHRPRLVPNASPACRSRPVCASLASPPPAPLPGTCIHLFVSC